MKRLITILTAVIMTVGMLLIPIKAEAARKLTDMEAYKAVFDATYYAKTYPDVVNEYGKGSNSLLTHYINYGIKEGRNASASFNASSYRARYADLNAQYGDNLVEYCRHYAMYGKAEKRDATPGVVTATASTPASAAETSTPAATLPISTVNTNGYTCLGTYSTKYNARIQRAINVTLAANRINGVVVAPGALFSYSNAILPRTKENGYVEAPIFINKKHGVGIGGGICQVSSTLYATMLTVGLPATERHPHSLPVTYLPAGMDATISGTTLDLKFINIYDRPLMITANPDNGVLTVGLWLKDN